MVMHRLIQKLQLSLRQQSDTDDQLLDQWISEAMLEEAVAQPPSGAWERLRVALDRRRVQRYGMWVLDEPLRDPPESLPTVLSHAQFRRAERLYVGSRPHPMWYARDNVFAHLVPTFSAMINY